MKGGCPVVTSVLVAGVGGDASEENGGRKTQPDKSPAREIHSTTTHA
jgi:hypothetical protein